MGDVGPSKFNSCWFWLYMLVSWRVSQDYSPVIITIYQVAQQKSNVFIIFTRLKNHAHWRDQGRDHRGKKNIDMVSCSGHVLNVTKATDIPFERCRIEQLRNLNSCFLERKCLATKRSRKTRCVPQSKHTDPTSLQNVTPWPHQDMRWKLFENAGVISSKISLYNFKYL